MAPEANISFEKEPSLNEKEYKRSRGATKFYGLVDFWNKMQSEYPDALLLITRPQDGNYYASSVCWDFNEDRTEASEIKFYFSFREGKEKHFFTRYNTAYDYVGCKAKILSADSSEFNLFYPFRPPAADSARDTAFQEKLEEDQKKFSEALERAVLNPKRTSDFSSDRLIATFDPAEYLLRQRMSSAARTDYGLPDFANLTYGQIMYRLGRLTAERLGALSLIEAIGDNEKSTELVYSSEKFGDRFAAAVRWEIGEYREVAAKEVMVAIEVADGTAKAVKSGDIKGQVAKVTIRGSKQQVFNVPIPMVGELDRGFLETLVKSRRKILEGLIAASKNPFNAQTITPRSIASSIRVLDSRSNNTITRIGNRGQRTSDYSNQRRIDEARMAVQSAVLEEEDWDTRNDFDDTIDQEHAHGEIHYDEGIATDDDGCDVYAGE
ncbi:MAG: hypothetical protein A3C30_00770 [Candidatus Levybacteria bacterium RIFCSPHIGHO2_02_FULL_40_18]|nr:MAG: hypothetical protein A2869_03160 [Candidatus Levybacteria bacterium RIFCSPHIGHO2_01_FULL_40_58]OGH27232.1 MAG: hypothetical protein A3C30_00770 [Candidatus Levybacteria bacterium RIFCSPHIGHO2_02_FULL_40_18]OGH31091.1 MAG: hypothetical protein A3E43_05185 [Candidatus Levybacteria bacterium RIFCSPHIGHO2_12_FULL_40_31]OGH40741.1 MAG: hypothetical protein A2894_03255 [Candidatus Levybacteria bacterium RIFCSPLOWO2_01_FULL_40_64]OGH49379.1 MAG: hypothetical protein A3I54_01895 [Candidatus Lev